MCSCFLYNSFFLPVFLFSTSFWYGNNILSFKYPLDVLSFVFNSHLNRWLKAKRFFPVYISIPFGSWLITLIITINSYTCYLLFAECWLSSLSIHILYFFFSISCECEREVPFSRLIVFDSSEIISICWAGNQEWFLIGKSNRLYVETIDCLKTNWRSRKEMNPFDFDSLIQISIFRPNRHERRPFPRQNSKIFMKENKR